MSVRAYVVEEIRHRGEGPDGQIGPASFNLWHDEAITNWLGKHTSFYDLLNNDGNGISEVAVADWNKMLGELGDELDEGQRLAIENDVQWAAGKGLDYIQYDCF